MQIQCLLSEDRVYVTFIQDDIAHTEVMSKEDFIQYVKGDSGEDRSSENLQEVNS